LGHLTVAHAGWQTARTSLDPAAGRSSAMGDRVGLLHGHDRRHVAVVITTDGRRVLLPVDGSGLVDASLLGLVRTLLVGLAGLIGLITGSRRENGGPRRNER
jgi:hypothetical protein